MENKVPLCLILVLAAMVGCEKQTPGPKIVAGSELLGTWYAINDKQISKIMGGEQSALSKADIVYSRPGFRVDERVVYRVRFRVKSTRSIIVTDEHSAVYVEGEKLQVTLPEYDEEAYSYVTYQVTMVSQDCVKLHPPEGNPTRPLSFKGIYCRW